MAKLTILGSAAAVPDEQRNNTYMLLQGAHDNILIDCAGCPLQALQRSQSDLQALRYLIVTHRHPDHIYGFPALVLGLWLQGREHPLCVLGEQQSLRTVRGLLELFRSEEWPLLYPVLYQEIPLQAHQLILDTPDFHITSSPGKHLVPSLALRIFSKASGRSLVYSGDTEPNDQLVDLAHGADILIHEATGEFPGHSAPAGAGQIAQRSGVKELILVHLPVNGVDMEGWRQQAAAHFAGPVRIAHDFDSYPL